MKNVKNYLINRVQRSELIKQKFIKEHFETMENVVLAMIETYKKGGKFVFMGNGGSAADSQHAAAEFIGRFKKDREPIAAIALTTDTSVLTAVANDYSYSEVFSRQIKALVKSEDLIFAISTSGTSSNIIDAIRPLPTYDYTVVSLTGGNGGELRTLSDYSLNVELAQGSAETQEVHIFILHCLIDLFEQELENASCFDK